MISYFQTQSKEETEPPNEGFEPLNLLPQQQIYNPIIDELPPPNPRYLDFEQYIAVKRILPREWSLTGVTNIPIKNNNNIANNKLTCDSVVSHETNVNFINTESTCSNLVKTTASPFWYANRIMLPKLPCTVKNKLTPFQILKQRLQNMKHLIHEKQNNQLNLHCDLKLTNVHAKPAVHADKDQQQQIKIKKIRLKRIGSYSSLYYNKLELQKVERIRNKQGLTDNTFKSGLIKLTKRKMQFNKERSGIIGNHVRSNSFNIEYGFVPIRLNVTKVNSCRNEKNAKRFNYNWNNASVSRNSKQFDSQLSGFHSSSSLSIFNGHSNVMNYSNTSQTQNDLSNKSEFQLKGNKKYL